MSSEVTSHSLPLLSRYHRLDRASVRLATRNRCSRATRRSHKRREPALRTFLALEVPIASSEMWEGTANYVVAQAAICLPKLSPTRVLPLTTPASSSPPRTRPLYLQTADINRARNRTQLGARVKADRWEPVILPRGSRFAYVRGYHTPLVPTARTSLAVLAGGFD